MKEAKSMDHSQINIRSVSRVFFSALVALLLLMTAERAAMSATIELNSTGGTTGTNGLHFYIDDTSKIQVRRLNNTGQVYLSTATPPSNSLDNGVFLRANGTVYGPSHTVTGFAPTAYSTTSINATSPANPSSSGVQQTVTNALGVNAGPQISIVWKYTTPLDFLTADVTLTIPVGYAVSAANPVRYYHVFDTFLGGSDKGCGVNVVGPPRIVGTYSSIAGACPTSTSLPASGTVVESFRERSGTFSNYCANVWNSFFTNGAPNCSVLQAAVMSNAITTTEIDTGIGVEYDFTAPGTYTFSYDFVIGTTIVPAYDHLEIQHDGAATLCPENVTVLACTSTTVPCPAGSAVNTGTLTGNLTITPAAPAVTVTPTTFSIGPSVYSPTVVLQGSGAGVYTLGIIGISGTVPLNGIKCWNGTAASCILTVANTPCVSNFECMEKSSVVPTYNNLTSSPGLRNPLYTKLTGTDFTFDVVAIQTGGAISTGYAGAVTVELFDDTVTPALCTGYSSPVATQALTFIAADNGRKTITTPINLTTAYRKLRCRATQTVPTAVSGCSSDQFSIRPIAISSVNSTNANADTAGASTTNSPFLKTNTVFNLTANTATIGYNDTPKIDTSLLEWLNVPAGGRAAPGTGNIIGAFTVAASAATGNGASGSAFTYDEVGYFRFKPQGVYDNTFTTYSSDLANGDCTNDASNILASGKYGCKFGNTAATSYFGRFIPDHFVISMVTLTNACVSGTPFSYFSQDNFATTFTVTAFNANTPSNLITQNYTDTFAKLNPITYLNYGFSASPLSPGSVLASSSTLPSGTWTAGVLAASAKHQISRPTALTGQTSITLSAAPTDGEVPAAAATILGTATMRYGRLRMQNAFGSESLDLPISVIAQYWNGNGWIQNVDDSCTTVVAPTSGVGLTFYPEVAATVKGNHLSAAETTSSVSGTGKLVAGDAKFKLSKPGAGNNGYVDITFTEPAWLQFPWKSAVNTSPTARATFGIYKNANEFIYMREIH